MYPNLIIALSKMSKNELFKPDIGSKAKNLLTPILKYETILNTNLYMNQQQSSITVPLSTICRQHLY